MEVIVRAPRHSPDFLTLIPCLLVFVPGIVLKTDPV